jgi:hypothetical protein
MENLILLSSKRHRYFDEIKLGGLRFAIINSMFVGVSR